MNAVYLMNQIHYEHIKLLLVTSRGSWQVKWLRSCTVVCALAMVASLEIKALNKAAKKQGLCSSKRVLGYCTNADLLGQWRKSYRDIMTSPQNPVVSNTLDSSPASGTCRPPLLVLAYMISFSHVVGLQWMHELHQQTCCVKYTSLIPHQPVHGACRPPPLVLAYMTSFSHVVGLPWMHELHQQTCCVKYTSLTPQQPVVPAGLPCWCLLTWQASVMWWVYNECMSTMSAWTSSTI